MSSNHGVTKLACGFFSYTYTPLSVEMESGNNIPCGKAISGPSGVLFKKIGVSLLTTMLCFYVMFVFKCFQSTS